MEIDQFLKMSIKELTLEVFLITHDNCSEFIPILTSNTEECSQGIKGQTKVTRARYFLGIFLQ